MGFLKDPIFNYNKAFKTKFGKFVIGRKRLGPTDTDVAMVLLREFFRCSFTSGINDVPLALTCPIRFEGKTMSGQHTHTHVGTLSDEEFFTGPFLGKDGDSGVVSLDQIMYSRYAMGINPALPLNRRREQVAFISLNPENLFDISDHNTILDLGDEIMTRSACADDEEVVVTEEGINLHPSLLDFLKDLDCFDCED